MSQPYFLNGYVDSTIVFVLKQIYHSFDYLKLKNCEIYGNLNLIFVENVVGF